MKKKIVTLFLVSTLVFTACGNTQETATSKSASTMESTETASTNDSQQTVAETETAAPQETETESTPVHALNEECSIKDWTFTTTAVEITTHVADGEYFGFDADEGNKYLMVDMTITNNGTTAASFLPSFGLNDDISAKVIYQGTYEFSATDLMGYSQEMHDSTVNPLSSKSGRIAFEIPDSVADSTEELVLVISAGQESVEVKLR